MTPTETFRAKVPGIAAKLMGDFPIGALDAAAVLGNLGHECNGFTTLQEIAPTVKGSRGGYGWPQWTGPRRRAYEAYCERNRLDPASDEANYAWMFLELKGTEAGAIAKLKAAKSLEDKVRAFERAFLRAGVPHYASRLNWAVIAQQAIGKAGLPPAPMPERARVEALNDGIREADRRSGEASIAVATSTTAGGLATIGGTVAVTGKAEAAPVPGGDWMLLGLGLAFVAAAVVAILVASRHRRTASSLRAARLEG